ncbi:hypothetical protein DSO57_1037481 [Entomophthora muscae]|uniref:Uncharacterized protein n=1 Tax=Entomophthora muscae TaxID=34485 RepID=A0ACC2RPY2_9FUNG|nr:hypothetical protein DSO57_1037481 [Entomophthora muscae]
MNLISKLTSKTKPSKKNGAEFLEGIEVLRDDGKKIKLNSLWRRQPVVLKVLRRLGCPLCRYETRILSELKPMFDEIGVRLVSITFDHVNLEDFLRGGFWGWEIYVDKDYSVYKALGLSRTSLVRSIMDMMSPSGLAAIMASRDIPGNFSGDGMQLGATLVVNPGGTIPFLFNQKSAAAFPSIKELVEVVGGDPDVIEETFPPECVVNLA